VGVRGLAGHGRPGVCRTSGHIPRAPRRLPRVRVRTLVLGAWGHLLRAAPGRPSGDPVSDLVGRPVPDGDSLFLRRCGPDDQAQGRHVHRRSLAGRPHRRAGGRCSGHGVPGSGPRRADRRRAGGRAHQPRVSARGPHHPGIHLRRARAQRSPQGGDHAGPRRRASHLVRSRHVLPVPGRRRLLRGGHHRLPLAARRPGDRLSGAPGAQAPRSDRRRLPERLRSPGPVGRDRRDDPGVGSLRPPADGRRRPGRRHGARRRGATRAQLQGERQASSQPPRGGHHRLPDRPRQSAQAAPRPRPDARRARGDRRDVHVRAL
jgi:hypothetical protein